MFRAIYFNHTYSVMVRNISPNTALSMKFDTGSVATVISVDALKVNVRKDRFISLLNERDVPVRIFHSASGNELMGYPVVAENVLISGQAIESFYYYLIVNVDYSISLLGDDFISSCEYAHIIADGCTYKSLVFT